MASALQGKLSEGVVANVLQFLGLNGVTGCLFLNATSKEGRVFLEKGRVVHVRSGNLYDIPALATQLTWLEGDFFFDSSTPIPEKTIRLAVDKLLLQAAQNNAENLDDNAQSGFALGATSILIGNDSQSKTTTVEMNIHTLKILPLLDGERTLAHVAEESRLPLESVIKVAKELIKKSIAQPKETLAISEGRIFELWQAAFAKLEVYVKVNKLGDFQVMWSKVANLLAEEYPCLDPFMPEIKYTELGLTNMASSFSPDYLGALLAVTKQLAKTYKLSSDDLRKIMKISPENLTFAELEASKLHRLIR